MCDLSSHNSVSMASSSTPRSRQSRLPGTPHRQTWYHPPGREGAGCPQLSTQRKLREFLGLVNFYHRFLSHCAELMQPLHALLSAPRDKAKKLSWNEQALTAFHTVKDALANATLLSYPKADAPTCLMTDASDVAVGAVLQQSIDGMWQPLSYFSRKMKPAEMRYSTFNCWRYIWLSSISATSWRDGTLPCPHGPQASGVCLGHTL